MKPDRLVEREIAASKERMQAHARQLRCNLRRTVSSHLFLSLAGGTAAGAVAGRVLSAPPRNERGKRPSRVSTLLVAGTRLAAIARLLVAG